jgi:hypothetical protein
MKILEVLLLIAFMYCITAIIVSHQLEPKFTDVVIRGSDCFDHTRGKWKPDSTGKWVKIETGKKGK